MSRIAALRKRIGRATGRDTKLDAAIADVLDPDNAAGEAPAYTSSVDACIALIHRALPGWGWHVGYGPKGVLPYATVAHENARFEATAPTVPLALLNALLAAKAAKAPQAAKAAQKAKPRGEAKQS